MLGRSADLQSSLPVAELSVVLLVFTIKLPITSTENLQAAIGSGKLRKPGLGERLKGAQQSMLHTDALL